MCGSLLLVTGLVVATLGAGSRLWVSRSTTEYAEHRTVIDIRTLEVMDGKLPRRALELVLDWAELHREELMRDWDLCQQHQQPVEIAPLE